MESILGITAEYDPFHNGHAWHLARAREQVGPGAVVCAMSGDFTQRGEPAALDKWTRGKIAVTQGVDLVFELPFARACSRAEQFASGAVDLLISAGVTHISYGCEAEHPEHLEALARRQIACSREMDEMISQFMKDGCSRVRAGELACREIFGDELTDLTLLPNNILALEYLKRMVRWEERTGLRIVPVPVQREGSGYRDRCSARGFAGAGVLRQMIADEEDITPYVPYDWNELPWTDLPAARQRLYDQVRGMLLRSDPERIKQIFAVGEGMENRLIREARKQETYEGFLQAMVSRRYTASAIRRIMVYILMDMEEPPVCPPYGRVLAASVAGRGLLRRIGDEEDHPLTIIANGNKLDKVPPAVRASLEMDVKAADMYNLVCGRTVDACSDARQRPWMEDIPSPGVSERGVAKTVAERL